MDQPTVKVVVEKVLGIVVFKDLYLVFLDEDQGYSIEETEQNFKKDDRMVKVVRFIIYEVVVALFDNGYLAEIIKVQKNNP